MKKSRDLRISTLVSLLLNFCRVHSESGVPRRLVTSAASSGWEEPAKILVLRIVGMLDIWRKGKYLKVIWRFSFFFHLPRADVQSRIWKKCHIIWKFFSKWYEKDPFEVSFIIGPYLSNQIEYYLKAWWYLNLQALFWAGYSDLYRINYACNKSLGKI